MLGACQSNCRTVGNGRRIGSWPMRAQHARRLAVCAGQAKKSVYAPVQGAAAAAAGFDSIEDALHDLRQGKFVVVLDDEDRENEGDLIMNADKMTTEAMAFMVEYTSGVICISMEGADMDRLRLPLMVDSAANNESMYTAFTITIDLSEGCTTGISAADRSATIRAMADPAVKPEAFRRPGHIFPLKYRPGGVLVRPGHTEAALDLARLSGSYPAGVLCEIVNKEDGSMSRTPQLMAFAQQQGLRIITIADLVRYRLQQEQTLELVASTPLDTRAGSFTLHCFRSVVDGSEHAALVAAGPAPAAAAAAAEQQQPMPVRLQLADTLVDVFGSTHCGQASGLDQAMAAAAAAGRGALLYIQSHADKAAASSTSSSSLSSQLEAYMRQQGECSTSGAAASSSSGMSADMRDYAVAAHMLRHLGLSQVELMGHSEVDASSLEAFGIKVAGCLPWSALQQRQQQQQQQGDGGGLSNGHHSPSNGSSSSAPQQLGNGSGRLAAAGPVVGASS
jgi:3,4-dihydroxy 2-butanone 4-phosphate synthase/GTP cyclohydrolase II